MNHVDPSSYEEQPHRLLRATGPLIVEAVHYGSDVAPTWSCWFSTSDHGDQLRRLAEGLETW